MSAPRLMSVKEWPDYEREVLTGSSRLDFQDSPGDLSRLPLFKGDGVYVSSPNGFYNFLGFGEVEIARTFGYQGA